LSIRHYQINDFILKNSIYIRTIETTYNIDNFRKNCKDQYDFILDTFRTLIAIYNVFFADSNLSNADKIESAINIMEEYLYIDCDKRKYSVRKVQSICDKYSKKLYRLINNWYEDLNLITINDISSSSIFSNIKSEIKKELDSLDEINFDSSVNSFVIRSKNTTNHYIFVCKFSVLYNDNNFISKTKRTFEALYGNITDDEFLQICLLYNLISFAYNGISNILMNKDTMLNSINADIPIIELYKYYLEFGLHLDKRDGIFDKANLTFLTYMLYVLNSNSDIPKEILLNYFDLFCFIDLMETKVNKDLIKKDIAKNIYATLIQVYKYINEKKLVEKILNSDIVCINDLQEILLLLEKIIDVNKVNYTKIF